MGTIVYRTATIMTLFMFAIGVLAVSAPGAMAADDAKKLNVAIQPYLWTPTIGANLNFSAPHGSTGAPEPVRPKSKSSPMTI